MVEFVKALVGTYLPETEEGQGLVEYGLIIALIAVVCIAALTALGTGVSGTLQSIVAQL
ncbi:MAG: Flp family type IVb pilin [Chloroflexia bacterium]|nr:Flp family type IVb pilin [Chloroflexia bacterium]